MNVTDTGRVITQARENRNLSRHELARRMGVSADVLADWENGKTFPDPMLLDRLAALLGLRLTELLQGGVLPPDAEAIPLSGLERDLRQFIALQRNAEIRRKDLPGFLLTIAGTAGTLFILIRSFFRHGLVTQIFGKYILIRWLAWPLTSLPVAIIFVTFLTMLITGIRWMRRVKLLKNLPGF